MSETSATPNATLNATPASDVARRDVYQYTVGGRPRFADPMAAFRKMSKAIGQQDLGGLFEAALGETSQQAIANEAWQTLVDVARATFDLPPIDPETGHGVTEDDAIATLASYCNWLGEKKGQPESSPTSSSPTEPPPSGSSGAN